MDRETVITDLQIIHTWAEFALERDLQFFTAKHLKDIAQWTDNALALLKEDCHNCKLECLLQKYDELKEKYDALLKEHEEKQEGLPPAWQDRTQEHICQKCGGIVWQEDNYCSKCGQAVKWK